MEVKILPSSFNKATLEIYLDGELWKKVSRKYFSKPLRALSSNDLKIKFPEIEKKQALLCGLDLLAKKAYTKKKLHQALINRHFSTHAINEAFLSLAKYINDEEMARSKIRILLSQGKGEMVIFQKLKAFVDFSKEEIYSFIEEEAPSHLQEEKLLSLIKRKYGSITGENRSKVIRFLISRGFTFDLIKRL